MGNTRLASSLAALLVSAAVVFVPAVARAGAPCNCFADGFDFNGDGKADLIRSGPTGIRVDLLDGVTIVGSGTFPNAVGSFVLKAVGLLTNDNRSGFVSQGNGTARVTFVNAAGTGTAGTLFIADGGGAWNVVDVADVSGDGIDEVVFEGSGPAAGALRIANIASGSPIFSYLSTGGGIWRYALAANLNGDASLDLLFRGTGSANGLTRANRNGGTANVKFYPQGGGAWILHAAGDFNNDGIDDLVDRAADPSSLGFSRVRVLDTAGTGNVDATGFVPTAGGTYTLKAAGDFTGDGNDDLGYDGRASFRIVPMNGVVQGSARFLGNQGGTFTLHRMTDTNGDGFADLISTRANGDVRVQMVANFSQIPNAGLTLF